MTTTWSIGTLVLMPVFIFVAAVFILAGIAWWIWRTPGSYDMPAWVGGVGGITIGALLLAGTGLAMWPWKAQYHQWQPVTGKVAQISSRLVGDSDSAHQKFVVKFTDGRLRGVDDTRAALVKPGDTISLKCKRVYQWGATPGWDCNWASQDGVS